MLIEGWDCPVTFLVVLWFHTLHGCHSHRVISKNFFTLICASWLLLDRNITSQRSSSGNTLCFPQLCFSFSQSSLVLTWAAFLFPQKPIRWECAFQNLSFSVLCTFSWTQQVSLWEHWMQCWTPRRRWPRSVSCTRPRTRRCTGPSPAVRAGSAASPAHGVEKEGEKCGIHCCLNPLTPLLILVTSEWFKNICKPELDSRVIPVLQNRSMDSSYCTF